MIALWMMYATLVTAIFAIGAAMFDRAVSGEVRQRRWIWMLALGLSAVVPLWTSVGRRIGFVQDQHTGQSAESPGDSRHTATKSPNALAELIARADTRSLGSLNTPLGLVWAATALLALGMYAAAVWTLAGRRRSWRQVEVDGQAVLLAPATGPAVVGALRPQIVVPEWSLALDSEQRALMIEHERQHVRAMDPLLLHVGALVALLMPWNLAAWWLNRRLRLAVELDCDARVLDRGHDARAYGTLLLDVCSRHAQPGVVLAPALFERASSLTRRILAMQPKRSRFPRIRVALGAAAALAIVVIACDMPSPEVLAPDGKNQASKRLYGEMQARLEESGTATRALVGRYFPEIARGEGGPSILFVVKSASGAVVLAESQPATNARTPVRTETRMMEPNEMTLAERRAVETAHARRALSLRAKELRVAVTTQTELSSPGLRFKVPVRSTLTIPTGIGALEPNEIASVDVSKHEAGKVAPNPVSIVTIVLKQGATVPLAAKP
jgi:beta-lactamase regulating signal transducer with metallopeptidase domain